MPIASSSPFFAPSDPRILQPVSTPGGTVHLVKKTTGDKEKKASILGTSGNLINAIVGAGIVGIPFAVDQAGLVAGIVLVVFCAVLTEKSLRLLSAMAKHLDVPSYEMLSEACFGMVGFYFISVSMFVMAYGAMVSYLMIVKDTLPFLLGVDEKNYAMRRSIVVISSLLVMFPLSSQRDMADLAKTSSVSVLFDIIMVFIVCVVSPVTTPSFIQSPVASLASSQQQTISSPFSMKELFVSKDIQLFNPRTIFTGLGVLSFAFVCQHSALIIAGSLRNPTQKRWSKVTAMSLTVCCILASSLGTCGYIGFGSETRGNILNNFGATSSPYIKTARALVCVTMFFVYPMESFVARHVTIVMFFKGRRAHEGNDHEVLARRDRRIFLTAALYLSALLPALWFEDMGGVLAVTGAIGGSCLSYIGPGCAYLGVHGEKFLEMVEELGWNKGGWKYCITGMQIWTTIARIGKDSVTAFQETEALKSPHPNRLGKVIHHKRPAPIHPHRSKFDKLIPNSGLYDEEAPAAHSLVKKKLLERAGSFNSNSKSRVQPIRSYGAAATAAGGGNSGIAAAIAARNALPESESTSSEEQEAEDDPQEEVPTWLDFFVAFGYILFGCLALTAGIVSIYFGKWL